MNQARTWTIGLVVVVLLIIAGGWQLGISPIIDQINLANSQAATIQNTNTSTEAQLASLKIQYSHIGTLRKKLDKLRLSVPEQAAASEFIDEVTELGASTGVTIESVDISTATDYAGSSATTSSTAPASSTTSTPAATATTTTTTPAVVSGSGLIALAVTVNASGTYSQAQEFLGLLQTGTRLFVVNTASLSGSGDGSSGTAVLSGNIFALQGTSDPVTSTTNGSTSTPTPYPTLSPTPTATPTPTSSAATKSGSSTTNQSNQSTPTPTPTPTSGS